MKQMESSHRISVLVHISEPLVQVGVLAALADQSDMVVIGAAPNLATQRVDVAITDCPMACAMAEDCRRFDMGTHFRHTRILSILTQARDHAVRSAMKQGVQGFVLTSSPLHELVTAIKTLARGRGYVCAAIAQQLTFISERDNLTIREDEVLRLLAKGQCNKSIARDLDIAVETVKVHVKSIMAKLHARSRTEAASIATERGLVENFSSKLQSVKSYTATVW